MANPQPTDPHMRIEHHIWESLAKCELSGAEFRVVLAILRKTWGWQEKVSPISQSYLKTATGIGDSSYLTRITKHLAECNIITKSSVWGKPTEYQFNKNYEEWTIGRSVRTDAETDPDVPCNGSTDAPSVGSTDSQSNSSVPTPLLYENKEKQHAVLSANADKPVLHPLVAAYCQNIRHEPRWWKQQEMNGFAADYSKHPLYDEAMWLQSFEGFAANELPKYRAKHNKFPPIQYILQGIVNILEERNAA